MGLTPSVDVVSAPPVSSLRACCCPADILVDGENEAERLPFPLLQMVLVYSSSDEKLTAVQGTSPHWLGGVCPPDVPVCGFKNDNPTCLTSQCPNAMAPRSPAVLRRNLSLSLRQRPSPSTRWFPSCCSSSSP